MILHRLNLLLSSRDPRIAKIRELIWNNDLLRETARFVVRLVRRILNTPRAVRLLLASKEHTKLNAFAAARLKGGSLSLEDLETIWSLRRFPGQVLLDMDISEQEQAKEILNVLDVGYFARVPEPQSMRNDLLVISTKDDTDDKLAARLDVGRLKSVIRLGGGRRSIYQSTAQAREPESVHRPLLEKLERNERLHIVLLNDIGFLYGAGTALKRQALSFLLKGWDVTSLAWTIDSEAKPPRITGIDRSSRWKGFKRLQRRYPKAVSEEMIVADIVHAVRQQQPDVVVTGNLHGAPYPLQLLTQLRRAGIPVMTYMHDVFLLTGRCAQPLTCGKFRTGCDAACPTPTEHPALPPEKIAAAWQKRADVFTGPEKVPLIANSHWTLSMVEQRFGDRADKAVVHLALDHELFAPLPRELCRKLLGITDKRPLVLMGAADIKDKWKGGALFHEVYSALKNRDDVGVVLFGRLSESLPSVKSFGLVDEAILPMILSAADIFVSTTIADSFGQTLLEASACGLPVVVPDVGGVKDVVVDGETGCVTGAPSAASLLAAIDRLVADRPLRETLGANGRRRVEEHYSLTRQAEAWVDCLAKFGRAGKA